MTPHTTSLFASTCAFALMTLLHHGQGVVDCKTTVPLTDTTSMCKRVPHMNSECPFVSTPQICEFVTKDTVSNLTWSFKRGPHPASAWEMRLVTKNFTLKPHQMSPLPGNITEGREFNVTTTDDEADHVITNVTTVSVSILFNEGVLEHVPYVFIKLFRTNCCQEEVYSSIRVNFFIRPPRISTTTVNTQSPTTTETMFNHTLLLTTSAESRPYLSFLTLNFVGLSIVTM